ncbi:hypothetical protein KI387_038922 [Taxus chinensis]|uniref:O-fucosyltransferase family protein n=1 Tax=Taxus chinensis TaxID=29808 RepID=A0AA38CER7_TAXCH|nr:hypothetical protein KI387_038922 [Taxus chinensis]
MVWRVFGHGEMWNWYQRMDLKSVASQLKGGKAKPPMLHRARIKVWFVRVSSSILLWTCLIQLMALGELWHPHLPMGWPTCFSRHEITVSQIPNTTKVSIHGPDAPQVNTHPSGATQVSTHERVAVSFPPAPILSRRIYKSNGYLKVSCNGGLNQMRAAICDMVTIARYLNLTLVIPELDKTSFWADPSEFGDIFDVKHFITSLRDEVRIIKELPKKFNRKARSIPFVMPPVSWSSHKYYLKQILPLFRKHKVIHFNKTDARLANNGIPPKLQKLRCRVNYNALKFTPRIEDLGRRLVRMLRDKGVFIALHLRYEMDMLAFSGCTHGCTEKEADELTQMRYAYPWWKEKLIISEQKRSEGLCPLTPEEAALVLKALGFDKNTQIYIAAGEIYGGEKRLAALRAMYPKIVRKEMLLSSNDLKPFQNHSSQMAALDYLVSVASDVFIPSYDGNMAKLVEGHRRYLGFRETILLDRRKLVQLLDMYQNQTLAWHDFALDVRQVHKNRRGAPTQRKVVSEKPKEEDYFYANPQECLCNTSTLPLLWHLNS